jgi:hypothetical protein
VVCFRYFPVRLCSSSAGMTSWNIFGYFAYDWSWSLIVVREICVYIKCASADDAGKVYHSLHGWWFDGNLVTVTYLSPERYQYRFPDSVKAIFPLQPAHPTISDNLCRPSSGNHLLSIFKLMKQISQRLRPFLTCFNLNDTIQKILLTVLKSH